MLEEHIYLVAVFAYKLNSGLTKHDSPDGGHILRGPVKGVIDLDGKPRMEVDLFLNHLLFAQHTLAKSKEEAEKMMTEIAAKIMPESEGWIGLRTSAVRADRKLMQFLLDSTTDEAPNIDDAAPVS